MAVPGIEPGSSGSQPLMLTTTPYDLGCIIYDLIIIIYDPGSLSVWHQGIKKKKSSISKVDRMV